jgi:CRISPR-associated protein Cas2
VADDALSYLICYDVPDHKRRARLAKLLDGYGWRVQYSVYEALLEAALFDKLHVEILTLIDAEADRVAVYRLCAGCAKRRLALGTNAADWLGHEVVFVV